MTEIQSCMPGSWNRKRRQMLAARSATSSFMWMKRPRFMTRKQAKIRLVTSTNMIRISAPRRSSACEAEAVVELIDQYKAIMKVNNNFMDI